MVIHSDRTLHIVLLRFLDLLEDHLSVVIRLTTCVEVHFLRRHCLSRGCSSCTLSFTPKVFAIIRWRLMMALPAPLAALIIRVILLDLCQEALLLSRLYLNIEFTSGRRRDLYSLHALVH